MSSLPAHVVRDRPGATTGDAIGGNDAPPDPEPLGCIRSDDPGHPRSPADKGRRARRVVGRLDRNTARGNASAGWSGGNDEWVLVLPAIMAWLAGWPEQPLPLHLETLFEAGLGLLDVPGDPGSTISQRFRAALAEAMIAWKETTKARKATLLDPCIRLALKGVKAILANGSHTAAGHAALWAAAAAEVLKRQRSDAAAATLLDNLASQRRWGADFQKELATCREQMTSGATLPLAHREL